MLFFIADSSFKGLEFRIWRRLEGHLRHWGFGLGGFGVKLWGLRDQRGLGFRVQVLASRLAFSLRGCSVGLMKT